LSILSYYLIQLKNTFIPKPLSKNVQMMAIKL